MQRQEARKRTHAKTTCHTSPFSKPDDRARVFERKNDCCVGTTEESGEEVNDFILCLGYAPRRAGKPVLTPEADREEVNDFIQCLGYGAE